MLFYVSSKLSVLNYNVFLNFAYLRTANVVVLFSGFVQMWNVKEN